MPDNKIITLENLTEFKAKCDQAYSGGGGTKLYKHQLVDSSYNGLLIISSFSDSLSGKALSAANLQFDTWRDLHTIQFFTIDPENYHQTPVIGFSCAYGTINKLYYIDGNGNIAYTSIGSSIASDTVMEL